MTARDRTLLGVLAVIGVMAGFWFGLLAPERDDVKALDDQIAQAEERRATAQGSLASVQRAKTQYQTDYATVVRLGKAVPADDDMASLVFQLESIADRHHVDFRAVKLSAEGTAAPAPAPEPAKPATGDKPAAGGEAATPAVPAAPIQAPPGSVVGEAGLMTMPFTFVFEGSYLKMQRFLKSMDGLTASKADQITVNGRLLTVDGFSLAAAASGLPRVKAEVKATAYLTPADQGVAAGATPSGPAGAAPAAGAPTAPNTTATAGDQG